MSDKNICLWKYPSVEAGTAILGKVYGCHPAVQGWCQEGQGTNRPDPGKGC